MSNTINGVRVPYIIDTDKPKKTRYSSASLVDICGRNVYYNMPFEEALMTLRSGIYNK